MQNVEKIFFLGLNKTFGSTLYRSFAYHGFKAIHASLKKNEWVKYSIYQKKDFIDENDVFIEVNKIYYDIDWFYKNYTNSTFILQYRNLDKWLVSRWNHVNRNKDLQKNSWLSNNKEEIFKWIIERDVYHKKICQYFDSKLNFELVNLDSSEYELAKLLNKFKLKFIYKDNIFNETTEYIKYPEEVFSVLDQLSIGIEDYKRPYLSLFL